MVWNDVHWDSSQADVVRVLEGKGLTVDSRPLGAVMGEVDATGAGMSAMISFSHDRPDHIAVTHEPRSKEAAAAILATLTGQSAEAPHSSSKILWRWDHDDTDAVILTITDDGRHFKEDYLRGDTSGSVGFASLAWTMSALEAAAALTVAGFDATVHGRNVSFSDEDDENGLDPEVSGEVLFGEEGMCSVELWGSSTDAGAARAKAIEERLGAPTRHEITTVTKVVAEAAIIDVARVEDVLTGNVEVRAGYRKKSTEFSSLRSSWGGGGPRRG